MKLFKIVLLSYVVNYTACHIPAWWVSSKKGRGALVPRHPTFQGLSPKLHDANSSLLPADFRSNYRAPPIRSVDVYNIMCSLAGVQPLPNNGSWSRVECMLRNTAPLAPLPPCSSCVLALALLSLLARQISLL